MSQHGGPELRDKNSGHIYKHGAPMFYYRNDMYKNFIINPGNTSDTTLGSLIVSHYKGFETPQEGIRAFAELWKLLFDNPVAALEAGMGEIFDETGWTLHTIVPGPIAWIYNFWELLEDPEYEHSVVAVQ